MTYPKAIVRRGPPSKTGYRGFTVNAVKGVVCHSMVGGLQAAMGELDNLDRRASWHYSVLKDGVVLVHYFDEAITWHCDSMQQNIRLIGIEHEGGLNPHNEPLTIKQREASVDLVRWLSQRYGFPLVRKVGLWEHREIAQTACPSGRIPWEYYTAEEEDMAAIETIWNPDFGRLYVIGQGIPTWIADPKAAADIQAAYGAPKRALSWAALKALGAT